MLASVPLRGGDHLYNYLIVLRKVLPGETTPIAAFDSKKTYDEAKELADFMADKHGYQCMVMELEFGLRLYDRDWPFQKQ